MSELKKTLVFVGFGTIAETFSSLVSNKVVALSLGPSGIGTVGQINNFYGLGVTLAELGLLIGITRFIAEAKEKNDDCMMASIIFTSFVFSSLLALILTILSYVFAERLSNWFLGSNSLYQLIWIAAPGLFFSTLYRKSDSVLQGMRDARLITTTRIIMAIIMPFFTIGFVHFLGVKGAVINTLVRQILGGTLVFFLLFRSLKHINISFSMKYFNWQILNKLFSIGLSTMIVSILLSSTSTLVRSLIVKNGGLNEAGAFQAAWGLIFIATSLTITTLSYYTFPKVSSLTSDPDRIIVMNESIAFGVSLITASSLVIVVPREFIVTILYRGDFNLVGPLLPLIGLGSVLYISWWIIGTPFVAKNRLKALVLLNAIPPSLFVLFTIIFLPNYGLISVAISYALANGITLVVFLLDAFKSMQFQLSQRNTSLIIGSVGVIIGQVIIQNSDLWGLVTRTSLAVGWFVLMLYSTNYYFNWKNIAPMLKDKIKSLMGLS